MIAHKPIHLANIAPNKQPAKNSPTVVRFFLRLSLTEAFLNLARYKLPKSRAACVTFPVIMVVGP